MQPVMMYIVTAEDYDFWEPIGVFQDEIEAEDFVLHLEKCTQEELNTIHPGIFTCNIFRVTPCVRRMWPKWMDSY